MDPERWPTTVRAFVDDLVCPRCGQKKREGKGILVVVSYYMPIWTVGSVCLSCNQRFLFNLAPTTEHADGLLPLPEGAPAMAEPNTQEPTWYRKMADLPPGGSE